MRLLALFLALGPPLAVACGAGATSSGNYGLDGSATDPSANVDGSTDARNDGAVAAEDADVGAPKQEAGAMRPIAGDTSTRKNCNDICAALGYAGNDRYYADAAGMSLTFGSGTKAGGGCGLAGHCYSEPPASHDCRWEETPTFVPLTRYECACMTK